MKILDVGCGVKKYKGGKGDVVIGLDHFKLPGVDVVADLEKGLPLKKNSFDMVRCSHVLEHIDNAVNLIEEIWRVLKPHGKLVVIVPYRTSGSAYGDITHKRFFSLRTMDHFIERGEEHYISKAKFRLTTVTIGFKKWLKPIERMVNSNSGMQRFYDVYLPYVVPASYIYWELSAVK